MSGTRIVLALMVALTAAPALAGPPRPLNDLELAQLVAAAGDAKDYPKAPLVVVLDESDVKVRPTGLAMTHRTWVCKVLTDAGARRLAIHRENFDPNTNRVSVDRIRIHRKDGTIENVGLVDVITALTRQWSIFWGGKQHLATVGRLEVGDAVEIRTRRIGFNIAYLGGGGSRAALTGEGLEPPMPGHWYEVARFGAREPILRKRYSVHMPKDLPLQYSVYNGTLASSLWFDEGRHVYTFSAENIPPVKREPSMASWDDCVLKVVLATVKDWPTKSRWFHAVNESMFEADDDIRAKVAEITRGLTTHEQKIAACLHWVSDNIRYYGTSRGPREGYTLHPGIETFRDRGGVCKDIAGMLITMLRVLEIEAYPALTMAGPKVEEIPADQFNHTVCVVRNEDGTWQVLDPTWSPVSRELWSSREAEQGLVYGTAMGEGLTLSPFFTPEQNAVRATSAAVLDPAGNLRTTLVHDLTGYACTYFRRSLDRHPEEKRREAIAAVLGIPGARIATAEFTAPTDYSRDSRAKLDVISERYAAAGGDRLIFKLPLMTHPMGRWTLRDVLSPPGGKGRTFPLRLRATRMISYEESVTAPEGYTFVKRPKDRKVTSDYADLEFTAKAEKNVLTYTLVFRAKHHLVPAKEVAGLKKAADAMKAIADGWVVARKEVAK